MNTLIHHQSLSYAWHIEKATKVKQQRSSTFIETVEFYRYGVSPLLLIFVICIASIAAAYSLQMGLWAICLVVVTTASVLAFCIALVPMRIVLFSAVLSVLSSLLVILMSVF